MSVRDRRLPLLTAGLLAALTSAACGGGATTGAGETARSHRATRPRRRGVEPGQGRAGPSEGGVVGPVGFVGLVVPHLLRGRVGQHPSRLLLPSFLGGAVLTSIADIAIRLMPPGPELKLGVVTALLGAPFFLHLIVRARPGAGA